MSIADQQSKRFFIGMDDSSHHYLVPVERYAEWWAWRDLGEDDERSWTVPEYAERIDGGQLTFADPKIQDLSVGASPDDCCASCDHRASLHHAAGCAVGQCGCRMTNPAAPQSESALAAYQRLYAKLASSSLAALGQLDRLRALRREIEAAVWVLEDVDADCAETARKVLAIIAEDAPLSATPVKSTPDPMLRVPSDEKRGEPR